MPKEQTQYEIALEIMQQYKILRMDQIKILGMRRGISCIDRYIREMKRKEIVLTKKQYVTDANDKVLGKDSTDIWILKEYFNTLHPIVQNKFLQGWAKDMQREIPKFDIAA